MQPFIAFALAAYLFLALAAVVDKVILNTVIVSPRTYAFVVGVLGVFALVLVPFYFAPLSLSSTLAALASGTLFTWGLWAFYSALKHHEASRVIPTVGSLGPLFTLIFSSILTSEVLGKVELSAFLLLVLGSVLVSFEKDDKEYTFEGFRHAAYAAILFAASFALAKYVFLHTGFINGLVWVRVGGVAGAFLMLALPETRRRIFANLRYTEKKRSAAAVALSQVLGGGGGVLQNYAIFLGSPTIVNALQGVQYAFVFVLTLVLSNLFPYIKEETGRIILVQKAAAIVLIGFGLFVLSMEVG